jgi:molybdate transport system substrate-binding protein
LQFRPDEIQWQTQIQSQKETAMKAIASTAGLVVACILLFSSGAAAADITVMYSGAYSAAIKELAPEYERATGNKVVLVPGPSMGATPEAIPNRLQRGETADVVILAGSALDALIKKGQVAAEGRTDLVRSGIAMAVRAGAPKPDISSVKALKRTMLKAKSIAYSDSASGVYIQNELLPKLGIAEKVKGKSKMIPAEPVGLVVARGEAEIGFQQISELRPIKGIDIVGPLPAKAQHFTIFSAGVAAGSKQPELARALIKFLVSPKAAPIVAKTGLEPIAPK